MYPRLVLNRSSNIYSCKIPKPSGFSCTNSYSEEFQRIPTRILTNSRRFPFLKSSWSRLLWIIYKILKCEILKTWAQLWTVDYLWEIWTFQALLHILVRMHSLTLRNRTLNSNQFYILISFPLVLLFFKLVYIHYKYILLNLQIHR